MITWIWQCNFCTLSAHFESYLHTYSRFRSVGRLVLAKVEGKVEGGRPFQWISVYLCLTCRLHYKFCAVLVLYLYIVTHCSTLKFSSHVLMRKFGAGQRAAEYVTLNAASLKYFALSEKNFMNWKNTCKAVDKCIRSLGGNLQQRRWNFPNIVLNKIFAFNLKFETFLSKIWNFFPKFTRCKTVSFAIKCSIWDRKPGISTAAMLDQIPLKTAAKATLNRQKMRVMSLSRAKFHTSVE